VLVARLTVFLLTSVLVARLTVFLLTSVLVARLTIFSLTSVLVAFNCVLSDYILCFSGDNARKNRSAMVNIIHRYFAGDKSLLGEIEANAASDHPVAQMARESLPQDSKEDQEDKKRKRELEMIEIQDKRADLELKRINNVAALANVMTALNPDWKKDQRLVVQMQDHLKNVLLQSTAQNSITNGESAELAPITVSQVAQDMNRRFSTAQLIQIGKKVAQKYRLKYGEDPSRHEQYVDGAVRKVNSYTERDRDLIIEAFDV